MWYIHKKKESMKYTDSLYKRLIASTNLNIQDQNGNSHYYSYLC